MRALLQSPCLPQHSWFIAPVKTPTGAAESPKALALKLSTRGVCWQFAHKNTGGAMTPGRERGQWCQPGAAAQSYPGGRRTPPGRGCCSSAATGFHGEALCRNGIGVIWVSLRKQCVFKERSHYISRMRGELCAQCPQRGGQCGGKQREQSFARDVQRQTRCTESSSCLLTETLISMWDLGNYWKMASVLLLSLGNIKSSSRGLLDRQET